MNLNQITVAKTKVMGTVTIAFTIAQPTDCCNAPEEKAAIVVVLRTIKSFAAWTLERSSGL